MHERLKVLLSSITPVSEGLALGGGCAPFSGNAEVAHFESLPIKTPTVPACSELW